RSAVPGQAYRYRVTAVNFEGRSAAATATTDLTRPLVDPTPNAATNGSARLALGHGSIQFTDNAFNETSYIIQRKAVGAPDSSFANIGGTPTSFNGPGQTGVVTF